MGLFLLLAALLVCTPTPSDAQDESSGRAGRPVVDPPISDEQNDNQGEPSADQGSHRRPSSSVLDPRPDTGPDSSTGTDSSDVSTGLIAEGEADEDPPVPDPLNPGMFIPRSLYALYLSLPTFSYRGISESRRDEFFYQSLDNWERRLASLLEQLDISLSQKLERLTHEDRDLLHAVTTVTVTVAGEERRQREIEDLLGRAPPAVERRVRTYLQFSNWVTWVSNALSRVRDIQELVSEAPRLSRTDNGEKGAVTSRVATDGQAYCTFGTARPSPIMFTPSDALGKAPPRPS